MMQSEFEPSESEQQHEKPKNFQARIRSSLSEQSFNPQSELFRERRSLSTSHSQSSPFELNNSNYSSSSNLNHTLSESLSSLYLPNLPNLRQLQNTIMSGLSWINQFEFNPATLIQNLLTANPFRRRASAQHLRSNNNNNNDHAATMTYSQYKFAKLLNGTIKLQTLKPYELIELSSFGLVELDHVEDGVGHEFQRYENDKPTWCDSCGEFLSTPVMPESSMMMSERGPTPASVRVEHLMRTYLECRKCHYVCHLKCHNLIRIDCQSNQSMDSSPSIISSSSNNNNNNNKNSNNSTITSNNNSASDTPGDSSLEEEEEIDSNNNHQQEDHQVGNEIVESDDKVDGDISTVVEDERIALVEANETKGKPANTENDYYSQSKNEENSKDNNNSDSSSEVISEATTKSEETNSSSQSISSSGLLTPLTMVDLKEKILAYNERVRSKGSGLGITLIDETQSLFRGFLRVHMNLTRPINVVAGKRPPSIYDIINEESSEQAQQQQRRTLTSFYMPRDTVKNIHITSDSTSRQVIKAMLKKFKVVDNPHKFALYLRRRYPDDIHKTDKNIEEEEEENRDGTLTIRKFLSTPAGDQVHGLKRLGDNERPLILQLEFDSIAFGSVDIVLQENDNADIAWDAFELPELRNFLTILEREEWEHLEHVKAHYRELKRVLDALIHIEMAKRGVERPSDSSGGGGGEVAVQG